MFEVFGDGLECGLVGETNSFVIKHRLSSIATIAVIVEGPSNAKIAYENDRSNGTIAVHYVPFRVGDYRIAVKNNDQHVGRSPFDVHVIARDSISSLSSPSSLDSETNRNSIRETLLRKFTKLYASIRLPNWSREPCFLKLLENDRGICLATSFSSRDLLHCSVSCNWSRTIARHLCVAFTPKEIGEHSVRLRRGDRSLLAHSLKIQIGSEDLADARKVEVSGPGLVVGRTHTDNWFVVDTSRAGFGGLSAVVEGPSKVKIRFKTVRYRCIKIVYRTNRPGCYSISLKFGNCPLADSPFVVPIADKKCWYGDDEYYENPRPEHTIRSGTKTNYQLEIELPGFALASLSTSVRSPSDRVAHAQLSLVSPNLFLLDFLLDEFGDYLVSIQCHRTEIPGSPFQISFQE